MCTDPNTLWAFLHQHQPWCFVWTVLVMLLVLAIAGAARRPSPPKA